MGNFSFCKCVAVILSLLLGVGVALLAFFATVSAAVPTAFILIFSAVVLLALGALAGFSQCSGDEQCKRNLKRALCDEGGSVAASAIGGIISSLVAIIALPATIGSGIISVIFFGLAVFFLSFLLVSIYFFIKTLLRCRRPCAPCAGCCEFTDEE